MSKMRIVAVVAAFLALLVSATGGNAAELKVSNVCHTVLKTSPTASTSAGLQPLPMHQVKKAKQLCKMAHISANKLKFFAKKKNHWRVYERHMDQTCKQIRNRQESVGACKEARSVVREHGEKLAKFNAKIEVLATPPIPKPLLGAFTCIHQHEAAWNDTGNPYWGGLQMDPQFEAAWGPDMVVKYGGHIERDSYGIAYAVGGHSNLWTPKEQIEVAIRAYKLRGFAPWPNTRLMCGLGIRL